jgi:hypothetical protein
MAIGFEHLKASVNGSLRSAGEVVPSPGGAREPDDQAFVDHRIPDGSENVRSKVDRIRGAGDAQQAEHRFLRILETGKIRDFYSSLACPWSTR